jgi:hypothetical protein
MSNAPIKPATDFAAWKKKYAKKHTKSLVLSDGREITVPPRAVWPVPPEPVEGEKGETMVEFLARAVVGQENWDAFIADGNNYASFMAWLDDEDDSGE